MVRPYYGKVQVCFDCERRRIGCHAYCEVYKDAKIQAEEEKKKAKEIKRGEYITISNNKNRQKEAIRRYYRKYGV